jgi:heat shock protein HslJ
MRRGGLIVALCALAMLPASRAVAQSALPDPFTARGNEPSWSLRLSAGKVLLSILGEPGDLSAPLPEPERVDRATLRFTIKGNGRMAVIDVSDTVCADTMTGMPFPWHVAVAADGRRFVGCGGDTLDVIRGEWQVERIDDRPLLGDSLVTVVFADPDRLYGQAPCNRFVATFALNGEGLSVAQAATTEMACSAGLMDEERLFLAVLAGAVRCSVSEDGKLVLHTSDARTIVARRKSGR